MDNNMNNPEIRSFTLNLDEKGHAIADEKPTGKAPSSKSANSPKPAAAKKPANNKVSLNDLVTMLNNSVPKDETDDLIPLKRTPANAPQSKVLNPRVKIIPPAKDDLAEARRRSGDATAPKIRVPILKDEDVSLVKEKPKAEPVERPKKRVYDPSAYKAEADLLSDIRITGEPEPYGGQNVQEPEQNTAPKKVSERKPAVRKEETKKTMSILSHVRNQEKAPKRERKLSATDYIAEQAPIEPEIPSATHQAAFGTLPENVYTERMSNAEIDKIIPAATIASAEADVPDNAFENTEYDYVPEEIQKPVAEVPQIRRSRPLPDRSERREKPQKKVSEPQPAPVKKEEKKAAAEDKPLTKADIIKLKREQKYKGLSNKISRVSGIILVAILGLVMIFNLISPDKEKSDNENRSLAQLPSFSISSVLDGSFMSDLSSYVADQFFNRDGWISLRLKEDELLGATESNGVYLGKNGYLIEEAVEPVYKSVDKNLEAINQFAANNPDLLINMAIITNNVTTMPDYLPDNCPARDQRQDVKYLTDKLSSAVNFIDTTDLFIEHENDYMYYRTDHHWTSLGAYYAFMYMAGDLGITDTVTSYHIYTVTDSFEGTMASTSGCHDSDYLDSIDIYDPADTGYEFYVSYDDTHETSYSLYQSEKLNEKDKYTVFLGGNHPKVTIKSTNTNGKVLLLIKDSYANTFVQFLTPYYEKIIMVDPRYYYESVSSLITNESVTDVLFLYNMNTYLEDTSLADILG